MVHHDEIHPQRDCLIDDCLHRVDRQQYSGNGVVRVTRDEPYCVVIVRPRHRVQALHGVDNAAQRCGTACGHRGSVSAPFGRVTRTTWLVSPAE